MSKIVKLFLGWRILLFLPVVLAPLLIVERTGYIYSQANYLISSWANFDGVHYISIAANGYIKQAAFFPLFPILIYLFSFGRYAFASGFLVSNAAFFVSLIFFYKLLRLDYQKDRTWQILFIMLLFPTSFFFGAVYSESLFFLLLILSFYFARKKKWFWSCVAAMLLSATRIVGILIVPALIFEFYVQKKSIREVFPFLITPLGLIAYAYYNFLKWGNWFYFVSAHSELANGRDTSGIILFPQTIYRYFKILLSLPPAQYEWWIAIIELAMFFFVSFLLYYAWRKKVRVSYLIFAFLAFLLPVSSGTFSGLPRYVIILFPIYIAISYFGSKFRNLYIILSAITLFILLMFFTRGYFVA